MQANTEIKSFIHHNGGVDEHHIMIHASDPRAPFTRQLSQVLDAYHAICNELASADMRPVFKRYFISDAANQHSIIVEYEDSRSECAVSILQQPPMDGTKIALWVWMQSHLPDVSSDNGLHLLDRNGYTQMITGGMTHHDGNSEIQTEQLLSRYEALLQRNDADIRVDCLRTWFFVNNIDVNYSGLVKARRENFKRNSLTDDTHFIASTGIEGRGRDHGCSVMLDTYGVRGLKAGQVRYLRASDYMNPTYEYGVTFERGTCVEYGDRTHVFISGTASIDNNGEILHQGDVVSQAKRTLVNIRALLDEAACTFDDVYHVIVYLRDSSDYTLIREFSDQHLRGIPGVIVYAPVCRPGWLIEIECMAVKSVCHPSYTPF